MKAKLVIGISFILVFIATFIIYLFVVNVVAPRFDLSSSARRSIEQAPKVNVDKNSSENSGNLNNNSAPFAIEGREEVEREDTSVKAPGESYDIVTTEEETGDEVNEAADVLDESSEESETEQQEVAIEEPATPQLDQTTSETSPTSVPTPEVKLPSLDNPITEKQESINRVFVGSYENVDQAKQAYDKVMDSGVEVAPIVKQVDGKYSLQMGAFSDKKKAKDLADKLNQQNFSAKVKSE